MGGVCVWVLQAPGPAEGVVGFSGRAAGSGLRAQGRAERLSAGEDPAGGGAQRPEGNQPEPGPQQRPAHQPVPGSTTHTDTHIAAGTHTVFIPPK